MKIFDSLLKQIVDEVMGRVNNSQTQTGKQQDLTITANTALRANVEQISESIRNTLMKALRPAITTGLDVTATTPPSMKVKISAGYGVAYGQIHELFSPMYATISNLNNLYYIHLQGQRILVDSGPRQGALALAKVVIPYPTYTVQILDNRNPQSDYDGYIISGKDLLFNNQFVIDDESIPQLRNTLNKIFAEYIFGTITLSEALKIANTQGTMMADSKSIKFYDANGAELAYYGADEARIGNILVTPSTVQSRDFQAGKHGFCLYDNGNAEFDNITARGTIYAQAGDITGDLYIGSGFPRILIDGDSANVSIGTNDFTSGYSGRGWRIDSDGSATFQNGLFRGELHTSVFVKDEIHATNGNLVVTNASVLASGTGTADTTIYTREAVFSANDVVRLKNESNSEYMSINAISGNKYTVTRNLDGTGANDWQAGEAVVGQQSRVELVASGDLAGYLPYIDVVKRNSTTWNDTNTMVRLGNLAGITDSMFGGALTGYGLYGQNVYLSGTLTSSLIQTTNTSNRGIKINTPNGFRAWDSSGNQRVQINTDGSGWFGSSTALTWDTDGAVAMTGATVRSATSGARINMDTSAFVAYSGTSTEVFRVDISGGDVGDVTIGPWANNMGVKWDNSAGTFNIKLSPQSRRYNLPGSSFRPQSNTVTYFGDTWLSNNTINNSSNFVAPVHLPDGANVTNFQFTGTRTAGGTTLAATLHRITISDGSDVSMATASISTTAGQQTVIDTNINSPTIDNSTYQYFVLLTMETGDPYTTIRYDFIVITYTITDPLP